MPASKKIAIVGLGLMGKRHLIAAKSAQNIVISAIVDVTDESKEIAYGHGIPHFDTVDEMINKGKPDGVVVATPNTLHIEAATLCIDKSIPVLVEKPLAVDIETVLPMLAKAEKKMFRL